MDKEDKALYKDPLEHLFADYSVRFGPFMITSAKKVIHQLFLLGVLIAHMLIK